MHTKRFPMFSAARTTLLVGMCLTIISRAADQAWNPAGPTNNWNTTGSDTNWDAGVVWTQNNNAIFGGTGETVNLITGISAGNLSFTGTGYIITGNTLTLASGSIIDTGANTATIGSAIANSVGSTGFTVSGTGKLTLSGATSNTYTGKTTFSGTGQLVLAKTGGTIAIPGDIEMACTSAVPGQRTVLSTLQDNQFSPNSVLRFTNSNDNRLELKGTTQTLAGLENSATPGNHWIQNNEFSSGSMVSTNSNLILNVAGSNSYTYTSASGGGIRNHNTGTVSLTKNGTGTQVLGGGGVTYTGATTVTAGTLVLSNTTGFSSAITNSATVEFNATSGGRTGATLAGAGIFNKTGAGVFQINGGQTITTTGQFNIQAGTLQNNNNAVNWSGNKADINISTGAVLDLFADAIYLDALTGDGVVQNNYGNTTGQSGSAAFFENLVIGTNNGSGNFSGTIRNNSTGNAPSPGTAGGGIQMEKTGSGTQILSGANIKHTGPTTVSAGTLALQNTTAWNSAITLGASNSPTVQLNAPLATDTWSFTKPISGNNPAAKVEKVGAGNVSLNVSQTHTGTTAVTAGKLMLASVSTGSMPSISGMKVWLDASDVDGDGNSANNPANGAGISTWVNKGTLGASGNFTATGTGAANPTLTTSIAAFNNKPAITFDDVGKQLANTTNFTNTLTVIYVGRIGATKQRLVSGGTVNWLLGYWNGNMNTNHWHGNGFLGSPADTNPHIWIGGATSGNYAGYRFDDGGEVSIGSGTGGFSLTNGLTLGGVWGSGEKSDGDITELLVFDHQLTTSERQQIEAYLYNKYINTSYDPAVSLNAASPVTVAANATFGGYGTAGNVTVATGGKVEGGNNGTGTLTTGSLTFNGTGTVLGTLAAGVTPIVVSGALTTSGGPNSISVVPANVPANGTYHFLQFGSYSGLIDNFKFTEPLRSMVLQKNGSFIDVVVSAGSNYPIWTGGGSGEWSINPGLGNWKLSSDSSPTDFMAFDNALFDDTATGTTNIVVDQTNIKAGTITFNNSSKDYTLTQPNGKDITTGSLVKTGSRKLTVSGSFTFPGGSSLGGGIVSIASPTALGTGGRTMGGGTLEYTGVTGTLPGATTLNSGGGIINIISAGAVVSHPGAFSGTAGLTKSGAGTLVLSGASYSGGTTITGGKLVLNNSKTGSSNFALTSGSLEFSLSSGTQQLSGGTISGSGTFIKSGSSDLWLGANGSAQNVSMTGGLIDVQAGRLRNEYTNGNWNSNKASLNVATGATVDLWDSPGGITVDVLTGGGTVTHTSYGAANSVTLGVNNGTGTFSGTLTNQGGFNLGVIKNGSGTQTLSGTGITYTGTTTINSGVLQLMNATGFASPVTVNNGGTLELNSSLGYLSVWNFTKAIAGSSAGNVNIVTDSGTVTLSGVSTYTGTTTIVSGILTVTGSIAASPLIDVTYAGTLKDTTAASGQTVRGTGILYGVTFGNGSTLRPGTTAEIGQILGRGITFLAGSTCVMRVHRDVDGTLTWDELNHRGDLTYGGTLTVTATGSAFADGDVVSLFPSTGVYRGSFSSFNLPTLSTGLSWDLSGLTFDGSIQVVNTLPTPIFNPPSGGYIGAQSITISSEAGSTIYYTLTIDGSEPEKPTTSSLEYSAPVSIPTNSTTIIKAIAVKTGRPDSPIGRSEYHTTNLPYWIEPFGGNWSYPYNWFKNVAAEGSGVTADFSNLQMIYYTTVTLDGARTVGRLLFGDVNDQYGWIIDPGLGGTLLLDNGASTPVINVYNQTTTINAATTSTTGLFKDGEGTLVLSTANITGPLAIAAGTLELGNINSSAVTLGSSTPGADEVTNPTLSFSGGGNVNISTLTVGANASGATLLSSKWAPAVNGITTLNRALTVKGVNTGAWNGVQFKSMITGNGAGIGNDSLIMDANGQTATSNGFVWQYDGAITNDFIGNIRVKGGTTNAQNLGSNWDNVAFPDAAMLTIDTGSTFRWNNTGGHDVLETLDGLAGGGVYDRAGASIGSTLTISANNAANHGDRIFSGNLVGLASLTKTGTGTQTFSGTDIAYTNATTIDGGTLELRDATSFASSAITVNAGGALMVNNITGIGTGTTAAITVKSGATLTGAGSVGGFATIEAGGTVAPGNVGIGALTINNVGFSGTCQIQVGESTSDLIAVTGTLTTTGTPSIAITTVGTPTAASYTIATYATLDGSLPTVTGVPSGYALDTSTTGEIKLLKTAAGFSAWADSWTSPLLSDKTPGGDPDHDGIKNLMEYVIGGDPRVSSTEFLPTRAIVGSNLVISYKRSDASESDTTQTGQWSANLTSWTSVTPVLVNENGALPDDMTVTIPLSNAVGGKLFGRISITQP